MRVSGRIDIIGDGCEGKSEHPWLDIKVGGVGGNPIYNVHDVSLCIYNTGFSFYILM